MMIIQTITIRKILVDNKNKFELYLRMYFVCDENKYIDCFNSFGDIDKAKEGRNKWKLQVAI